MLMLKKQVELPSIYLHLCRQQAEMDNRMSALPTLEKFLRAPMPVLFVFTI